MLSVECTLFMKRIVKLKGCGEFIVLDYQILYAVVLIIVLIWW